MRLALEGQVVGVHAHLEGEELLHMTSASFPRHEPGNTYEVAHRRVRQLEEELENGSISILKSQGCIPALVTYEAEEGRQNEPEMDLGRNISEASRRYLRNETYLEEGAEEEHQVDQEVRQAGLESSNSL